MESNYYWVPFKINEPGCTLVVQGPYRTREEAMRARERMKATSALNEYVGTPFLAQNKKEALERAKFF
jgi:hypothetical protein